MTTNPTPIPEPTSPTAVVVGKRGGETVVAVRNKYCPGLHWAVLLLHEATPTFYRWSVLGEELTDIRVVDVAEVASKPKPGPWLRGDELKDVMSTLKAGDVVEVDERGHTATGDLWPEHGCLVMWGLTVRTDTGKPGSFVDALRIIERVPEPEPGADIPDEVVVVAGEKIMELADKFIRVEVLRAALAAADAKRAELAGGVA